MCKNLLKMLSWLLSFVVFDHRAIVRLPLCGASCFPGQQACDEVSCFFPVGTYEVALSGLKASCACVPKIYLTDYSAAVSIFILSFLLTWLVLGPAWCPQHSSIVFLSISACITHSFWFVKQNTFAEPFIGANVFITVTSSLWLAAYVVSFLVMCECFGLNSILWDHRDGTLLTQCPAG